MHAARELRRNQDVMKFSRVVPPDVLGHSRNLGDGVYCLGETAQASSSRPPLYEVMPWMPPLTTSPCTVKLGEMPKVNRILLSLIAAPVTVMILP
jgi:hypothetical protein